MNDKINWKQKLSSRKLWIAVIGIIVGLAAAFGIQDNDYAEIAGIVTSAVSVFAYIFGEAKADAVSRVPIILPSLDEKAEEDGDNDENSENGE